VSKIEIGRFSELLRRMLGMKGQTEVAGELSPEISPTLVLEGPTAEWDFLKGVRGCACAEELAGGVGFTTRFRLRNPQDSGVIAEVHFLTMSSNLSPDFNVNRGQIFGELPQALVTVVPDLRWGAIGTTTTALIFSGDNASAAGPAGDLIATARVVSKTVFTYSVPTVLVPGTSLDWGLKAGITDGRVFTFAAWKERQLPRLEL